MGKGKKEKEEKFNSEIDLFKFIPIKYLIER